MPLRLRFFLLTASTLAVLGSGCVRKQFFQADALPDAALPLSTTADTVRGATAGRQYARHGGLYNALVGQHHRRTWAAPVTAPVLRLAQVQPGGLHPGKIGGGFNSTSLGLTAANGPAYVLRTVDKDPIRAMPEWLRGTFLVNALRDNVSSTNPYASLVVPPLATAVGVPRAAPRLFYVRPDDPAFQTDSLRHFRGQLAYLEEKAAVMPDAMAPAAVVNSGKVFTTMFNGPACRLDQVALLRARLLDGWLGDWDRHPGQWSWAEYAKTETDLTTVSPLPKDRDMVFYRVDDGILGWLIGHVALPHWATFGPRYRQASGLMASGHYLDRRGLNSLSRAQFQAVARAMQQLLPDTLINRAVQRLPPAVFALEGPRTIAALQARRAELPALADLFYRLQARRAVVGGTAQPERFEIHRYADSTVVNVYPGPAAGPAAPLLYHRAFFASETHVIQLESLGGDDVFVVEEHASNFASRPKIRIYGGPGADELHGPQHSRGISFQQGSAPAKAAYDKLPEE
ncbi:hypothetical protein [Hymenobacter terricola]|uniref:hypothetical protein n=1 Tax=Hymenobacter terricola TaxID=2819236 RepID=UPI001B317C55|nr:hypothetical protein [Hymenobacter terricola]